MRKLDGRKIMTLSLGSYAVSIRALKLHVYLWTLEEENVALDFNRPRGKSQCVMDININCNIELLYLPFLIKSLKFNLCFVLQSTSIQTCPIQILKRQLKPKATNWVMYVQIFLNLIHSPVTQRPQEISNSP